MTNNNTQAIQISRFEAEKLVRKELSIEEVEIKIELKDKENMSISEYIEKANIVDRKLIEKLINELKKDERVEKLKNKILFAYIKIIERDDYYEIFTYLVVDSVSISKEELSKMLNHYKNICKISIITNKKIITIEREIVLDNLTNRNKIHVSKIKNNEIEYDYNITVHLYSTEKVVNDLIENEEIKDIKLNEIIIRKIFYKS